MTSATIRSSSRRAAHVVEDLREVEVALGCAGRHHVVDLRVALGVQRGEGEVFELLLDVLHAQPVRERRVDVERLLRDPLLLPVRQRRERAHVVEPVGQLDDQDPQVLGHRHEHLAHRRGLLLARESNSTRSSFVTPSTMRGDLVAELGLDGVDREPGVLDGVVQQRGGDRDVVEAEIGHDARHRERDG